jgi:hypothetical protein
MNYWSLTSTSTAASNAYVNPSRIYWHDNTEKTVKKCPIEKKEHLPEELWNIDEW